MPRCRLLAALAVALAVLPVVPASAQAATALQPHRAIYALSLLEASSANGVSDIAGELYFEWSATCGGWRVNQHVAMVVAGDSEPGREMSLRYASTEARDGSSFDFTLLQQMNGQVIERIAGTATKGAAGGLARFEYPSGGRLLLPPGTLFPAEYALQSIAHVVAGEAMFSAPFFDGSTAETVYSAVTFAGTPERVVSIASAEPRLAWPAQTAYFELNDDGAEPAFEVGAQMFENGVANVFTMDHGSFAVLATLDRYEALGMPDCPPD